MNNILIAQGELKYDLGRNIRFEFMKNVFFGSHVNPPADAGAIAINPLLVAGGSGGIGLDMLEGYQPQAGSPCIGAAIPIPGNGGRDFWENPVRPDGPACIGVQELTNAGKAQRQPGKE
jgi:hypothetical protein